MKTNYITLMITLLAIGFLSCDENEELPDFLNGTAFGILLNVDVTAGNEVFIADINTSTVSFDVSYDDGERPVQSIVVRKYFVTADGTASDKVEQMTVTASPATVTLSISDLVGGISGLDIDDIAAGDSFRIEFVTNYVDGLVVDNYGTGVNPNFSVAFMD